MTITVAPAALRLQGEDRNPAAALHHHHIAGFHLALHDQAPPRPVRRRARQRWRLPRPSSRTGTRVTPLRSEAPFPVQRDVQRAARARRRDVPAHRDRRRTSLWKNSGATWSPDLHAGDAGFDRPRPCLALSEQGTKGSSAGGRGHGRQVAIVQRGGLDVDDDLARAGHRIRLFDHPGGCRAHKRIPRRRRACSLPVWPCCGGVSAAGEQRSGAPRKPVVASRRPHDPAQRDL